MKKEIYYCDVCEKELTNIAWRQMDMQVIFTTEQDEGKSTTPYFSRGVLDLCGDCRLKALSGLYIFASGAMGHNEYHFKIKKDGKNN